MLCCIEASEARLIDFDMSGYVDIHVHNVLT